ncbi:MAG: amidase domain-containing protein [Oscillospiraceae bacterium]|jgi:hypothetical protein|nr:amidase domain-containing protein [Oscillospiraceae bacterium]
MKTYDRAKTVAYAHQWAMLRNNRYLNFENLGGDCTSFASQCLHAGAGTMNYTPTTGWFYNTASNRTASWTGVEFLYKFLINNKGAGPSATEQSTPEGIKQGDIVQLSFDGVKFSHTAVIVECGRGEILVAAHTYDCDNRPLSSYEYKKLRFLHINDIVK